MGIVVKYIEEDHDYISKSLNIMQTIFMNSEESALINKKDLSACISFNAIFTGTHHNEKEETILFGNLKKQGNEIVRKVIDALSAEHHLCRTYIKNLQDLFPDNPCELISPRFITAVVGYINHMESHIEKENKNLFPIIDRYLTDADQEKVCGQFIEYEEYVMEACGSTYIKRNMDYLWKKYS